MMPRYGSDLLVERLVALGCTHLAYNPGATLRGLQDSLERTSSGVQGVLALHEEIAVAIAHGYAKASGRLMAVGLHDTVGLLHASMALFNAWADRVPLLALVGTGPLDANERRPWIDWIHTVTDQGEFVREFTVHNDQPTSIPALLASLERGWHRAGRDPAGPALVSVDVLLQEEKITTDPPHRSEPPVPRGRLAPDPDLLGWLAAQLRTAEAPLFVTDRPLSPSAGAALVALAETLGAGLVELGGGASFPVGHPHDLSETRHEALARSDLVVFVDVRDPAWAVSRASATERAPAPISLEAATTVAVGVGPSMSRQRMLTEAALPELVELVADPGLTLTALADTCGSRERPLPGRFADLLQAQDVPVPASTLGRVHPGRLGMMLREALEGRDWTVAYGDLGGWARRTLRYQEPGQYLGRSGGEGLGYGPGASVGAALAARGTGRVVVDLQGDGDLLYTPQALWTAAREEVPLLVVVDGNDVYYRDEVHQEAIARLRGHAPASHATRLDAPPIDFPGLARSFGVTAFGPVRDDRGAREALAAGVAAAAAGEPALVDVRTLPPR